MPSPTACARHALSGWVASTLGWCEQRCWGHGCALTLSRSVASPVAVPFNSVGNPTSFIFLLAFYEGSRFHTLVNAPYLLFSFCLIIASGSEGLWEVVLRLAFILFVLQGL